MLDSADAEALGKLSNDASTLHTLNRDQIKRLQSHVRSELQNDQKNIDALEESLRKAKVSRAQRNLMLKLLHRGATSWAGPCLPAELLAQIFCNLKGVVHFPVWKSDITWILPQVCRRWRDVALGEGELWTEVHARFSSSCQDEFALEIMARLLQRSGDRPISLLLDCKGIPWFNPKLFNPFFTSIVLHTTHRTVSLALLDMSEANLDELCLIVGELSLPLFPRVSKLKIAPMPTETVMSQGDNNHRSPTAKLVHHMPNVTSLALASDRRQSSHFPDELQTYPWGQFREISLSNYHFGVRKCVLLLSKTRDLRAVKLRIDGTTNPNEIPPNPTEDKLRLSRLEELDLTIDEGWNIWNVPLIGATMVMAILTSVSAPRLTKLTLSPNTNYGPLSCRSDEIDAIKQICTFNCLTSLELKKCINIDIDLLLQRLPRLQFLSVYPHPKNELSLQSIMALASNEYRSALRSIRCYLAPDNGLIFISMLDAQWTRYKNEAHGDESGACLHQAEIFMIRNRQQLAETDEEVRRVKTCLGVDFDVKFRSYAEAVLSFNLT